jgi:hypothetical protein
MAEPPLAGRVNTIYDLTALRLHPDGARVHQTSSKDNLRLGRPKAVFGGPKRGWFAEDAAGSVVRLGKRRGRRAAEGEEEEGEEGEGCSREDGEVERGRKMKRKLYEERKGEKDTKSKRAKKRLRFKEDDTFLADASSSQPHIADGIKDVDDISPPSSVSHSHISSLAQRAI